MLAAVASERLSFSVALEPDDREGEESRKLRFDELSARKKKRLRERLRSLRDQRRVQPVKSRDLIGPRPQPRYDEVFEEGVAWLDELAGPKLVEGDFTVEFSDDMWNFPTRKEGDVKLASEKNPVAEKLDLLRTRAVVRSIDVAKLLGTTPETVSRWKRGRAYPRPNKEHLLVDLEYVVERLSELYSDPGTARSWLYSRHKYFDGLRPADLIQEGRIGEVLGAIEAMTDPGYT